MQSEAVIFDFDGVILDSEPIHYEACMKVLQTIGITFSYVEYCHKYIGLADKNMFPKILFDHEYTFALDEVNQLIHDKINAYTDFIYNSTRLPIINGVYDYITYLTQERKKLAICTGSTRTEVMAVLSKMKKEMLTEYFKIIITSEDVKNGKPSPEGYLLTSKHLGVPPNCCLVIEDSPHGVKAAKTAGMTVIALETTHDRSKLDGADKIVPGFEYLF